MILIFIFLTFFIKAYVGELDLTVGQHSICVTCDELSM